MKGPRLSMDTMPSQKEELRQQIEDKNWDALLTKVPVKAGDFFYAKWGPCTLLVLGT